MSWINRQTAIFTFSSAFIELSVASRIFEALSLTERLKEPLPWLSGLFQIPADLMSAQGLLNSGTR